MRKFFVILSLAGCAQSNGIQMEGNSITITGQVIEVAARVARDYCGQRRQGTRLVETIGALHHRFECG